MAKAVGAMALASHIEATDESFIASTSSHVLPKKHRHAASEQN